MRIVPPFEAERAFSSLVRMPDLDAQVARDPALMGPLQDWLDESLDRVWRAGSDTDDAALVSDRLASQRILYGINRLRLYWFDDPAHYVNEHSRVLHALGRRIENAWQAWLEARLPASALETSAPDTLVRQWFERDRVPVDNADARWFATEADLAAYRRLLEIASLNGLVEASQMARVLGGASDPVQSTLTRIFLEEYGGGRLHRKHSTFFAAMLEEQGLSTQAEAYLDRVPWQVLAVINQAFFLTESRSHYLRFCGAFTYTEVSTPASFARYVAAAQRLGLASGRTDYWTLHVKEDARHGQWMIDEIALPLIDRFPAQAPALLQGYARQRLIEGDAARATAEACRAAAGSRS